VETITLAGSQDNALRMAFPQAAGRILNLRDLEQGLDQLNRLRSRALTIDILPGSREGFSRVELIATDHHLPVSLSLGADNSGQKSTGSRQMNAQLTVDNPFRLADQWMLSAVGTASFIMTAVAVTFRPESQYLTDTGCSARNTAGPIFIRPYLLVILTLAGGTTEPSRLSVWRLAERYGVTGNSGWRWIWPFLAGKLRTVWETYRLGVSSPTLTSVIAGLSYSRTLGNGYLTIGPSLSHGLSLAGATRDDPRSPRAPAQRIPPL
jgi:hemolysin activation/secretion protein